MSGWVWTNFVPVLLALGALWLKSGNDRLIRERDEARATIRSQSAALKRGHAADLAQRRHVEQVERERDAKRDECREQSERAAHYMARAEQAEARAGRLREAVKAAHDELEAFLYEKDMRLQPVMWAVDHLAAALAEMERGQ